MARIPETEIWLAGEPDAGLQARLREVVSRAIWEGRFAPGDRLPATRALAAHLGVARITVALAYEELAASGWLESRPRSGVFVAAEAPSARQTAAAAAGAAAGVAAAPLDWAARLGPDPPALGAQAKPPDWRRFRHPFVFGQPDAARFPLDDWRACARLALGRAAFEAVADDAGDRDDPMLVEQILRRSVSGRGVSARAEEVLVTLGAQNALWLACEALFDRRPVAVGVEDPGYPEMRHLLRRLGATPVPVPVDRDGLVVSALPPGLSAVFVTPSHQAPTGVTMSMARRHALLAWAEAADAVVLEDDYDFETTAGRPHAPALTSLDRSGRVVYVGSFSKSLFPGLRLGYLVAPAPVAARARAARAMMARHPPGITQRATAHFLALGHYNAHARALRARMARRRVAVLEGLEAHGLAPADGRRQGGGSIWVEGPPGLDAGALAVALREEGVLIEPGAPFHAAEHPPLNRFRLGFSVIPTERIPQGVARICAAVRRMTRPG